MQFETQPSRHRGDYGASFSRSNTSGIVWNKKLYWDQGRAHGGWWREIMENHKMLHLTLILVSNFGVKISLPEFLNAYDLQIRLSSETNKMYYFTSRGRFAKLMAGNCIGNFVCFFNVFGTPNRAVWKPRRPDIKEITAHLSAGEILPGLFF